MRTLLLMVIFLSLHAAEGQGLPREDFTLTDGRTFTGTYSADDNALLLDGGKVMLHITPDQIKDRGPAKAPLAVTGEPLSKKKDAPADMEAFKQAKKDQAAAALEGEADKADREAVQLLAKADACKQKAKVVAKSFQDRATAEGDSFTIEAILSEPLMVKKTSATNGAILALMKDADRFAKEAAAKQAVATAKRAEAARMNPQEKPDQRRGPGNKPADNGPADPRMTVTPESAEACRKLADELEAEEVAIRVRPVNDRGLDPAWIEGTPEYNSRQAKVDASMKRINQLRRMALFMDQHTAPPEDKLHNP